MFWHALDVLAEVELPPDLRGCTEQEIRERLIAAFRRMKNDLRAELLAAAGDEPKPAA